MTFDEVYNKHFKALHRGTTQSGTHLEMMGGMRIGRTRHEALHHWSYSEEKRFIITWLLGILTALYIAYMKLAEQGRIQS